MLSRLNHALSPHYHVERELGRAIALDSTNAVNWH